MIQYPYYLFPYPTESDFHFRISFQHQGQLLELSLSERFINNSQFKLAKSAKQIKKEMKRCFKATQSPPLNWTVQDVCFWLESIGLGHHIERFLQSKIDGNFLIRGGLNVMDMKQLGVVNCLELKRFFFELNDLSIVKQCKVKVEAPFSPSINLSYGNLWPSSPAKTSSFVEYDVFDTESKVSVCESITETLNETVQCSDCHSVLSDDDSDNHTIVVESSEDEEEDFWGNDESRNCDGGDAVDSTETFDTHADQSTKNSDENVPVTIEENVLESESLQLCDDNTHKRPRAVSLPLTPLNISTRVLSHDEHDSDEDSVFTVSDVFNVVTPPARTKRVVLQRCVVMEDLGWYDLKSSAECPYSFFYMTCHKPNGERYKSREVLKSCVEGRDYFTSEFKWFTHAIQLHGKEKGYVVETPGLL